MVGRLMGGVVGGAPDTTLSGAGLLITGSDRWMAIIGVFMGCVCARVCACVHVYVCVIWWPLGMVTNSID